MRTAIVVCMLSVLVSAPLRADEKPKPEATPKPEVKEMSGMSILGNQDAPKSLVIVPWKSSEIGNGIGISNSLNNRPVPVDRDVFARQLSYYRISGDARP